MLRSIFEAIGQNPDVGVGALIVLALGGAAYVASGGRSG
jgi:hypothetical protein